MQNIQYAVKLPAMINNARISFLSIPKNSF